MRTINSAKNPKWSDPTGYRIDLEVDFDELDEVYVSFTAAKDDPLTSDYDYSHELFNRAVAGEFGPIADYELPSDITGNDAMDFVRQKRNLLLQETDYIEMPTKWATLSEEQQIAWATYRNALRDLPSTLNAEDVVVSHTSTIHDDNPAFYTISTELNITFPTKPE